MYQESQVGLSKPAGESHSERVTLALYLPTEDSILPLFLRTELRVQVCFDFALLQIEP